MRVVANLTMLFTDVPFIERYGIAAKCGFKLVEVSRPYLESAERLKEEAEKFGLRHTLINAPAGDWAAGFRGLASLSSHVEQFKTSIDTAIHYARTLDCPRVHVMAGIPPDDEGTARETYVSNIKYAAEKLSDKNIMCLIEPINAYSIKGYHLNAYDAALGVLQRLQNPNLKILFDVFHAQQINGQLTATVKNLKEQIGYIQVAQAPHRLAPFVPGEINFDYMFTVFKEANPDWFIGLEYNLEDSKNTENDFTWIQSHGLTF